MRTLLLSILFLSLCVAGHAQAPADNASSLQQSAFSPGHYYEKDGTKVTGLLRHTYGSTIGNAPDNFVDFKSSPDASAKRLTVYDINAFVLGQDSFTVKKDFSINDFERYDQDFVQVVSSGEINLYLHYSTKSKRSVLTHWVERFGEAYPMNNSFQLNEHLTILVAEDKELLQKIRKKEYKLEHLPRIVTEYNQWHAQRPAKP